MLKSKKLASKILLAVLLTAPYGVGEAASSINTSQTINDSITIDADGVYNGSTLYGVMADSGVNINLTGDEIVINSESNTYSARSVYARSNGFITLGNGNSLVTVNATGNSPMGVVALGSGSKVIINAKELNVNTNCESGYGFGIHVQNNTQTETAPEGAASLTINADKITVNSNALGISAFSNGQMTINGDLTVNAVNAIDARGNATININTDGAHTTVLNGDIVFETPNTAEDAHNSGNLINAYVNINLVGEESSWTGKAYQYYADGTSVELNDNPYYGNVIGFNLDINDGAVWNMTGDSFVNDVEVTNGGAIYMQEEATEFNIDKMKMNEGTITLAGEGQAVTVNSLSGDSGTVEVGSSTSTMAITSKTITSLTVAATEEYSAQLTQDDIGVSLQNLANQVTSGDKTAADVVSLAETAVTGAATAMVDEYGNVILSSVTEAPNTTNEKISNMAGLAYMAWRAENNDMNKRLGELRDSKGEHGIWARMVRGESDYRSIDYQYNTYQLGYDEKLSTNDKWTVGGAITYTEGDGGFNGGSAETKHTGFALYGSYLNDDGSFIDLIAKYARLEHDYDVTGGAGSGGYDTNGYSVSAEYGKRFTQDNGFWIEPQVELTYGKVGSADYMTENGVKVRQDGMDSLVGRLGFAMGKNFKQGNAYVRASYLYDFDGETTTTFSNSAATRSFEDDLGGGWWEVGVGTNINLSDATHLYFDVEKTYGGDVATPWQWNLGVRYSF